MTLHEFLTSRSREERRAFHAALGKHPIYIQAIAGGKRKPSATLAINIEIVSGGLVRREVLRPDVFGVPDPKERKRREVLAEKAKRLAAAAQKKEARKTPAAV